MRHKITRKFIGPEGTTDGAGQATEIPDVTTLQQHGGPGFVGRPFEIQDSVTLSRNGCQESASLLALSNWPSSKSLPTHLKYSQRNDASGNWYTCSSGTQR